MEGPYLLGAGVAILASVSLLFFNPVNPVEPLEPLGCLHHLGEAACQRGHLSHTYSTRTCRLLRNNYHVIRIYFSLNVMTHHTFPFCSLVFVTFHFLNFEKVDYEVQLFELLHWIALE